MQTNKTYFSRLLVIGVLLFQVTTHAAPPTSKLKFEKEQNKSEIKKEKKHKKDH